MNAPDGSKSRSITVFMGKIHAEITLGRNFKNSTITPRGQDGQINKVHRIFTMSDWLAAFGSVVSFLACKGLLVFFGVMSALGASMSLDGKIWMRLIVAGASVALVCFAINALRHKGLFPSLPAAVGAGAVYYSYFVQYFDRVETAGLITLLVAAVVDYRSLRNRGSKPEAIAA